MQADDGTGGDGGEGALHDRVRTGVVVVEGINVEAQDGGVPGLGGDVEHLLTG